MAEREQIKKQAPARSEQTTEETTPPSTEKGEKLKAELDDLRKSGCRDRMATRFESATRVDGQPPTECRRRVVDRRRGFGRNDVLDHHFFLDRIAEGFAQHPMGVTDGARRKGRPRGPGARAGRRDYSHLPRAEVIWDFEGGYCCPECGARKDDFEMVEF